MVGNKRDNYWSVHRANAVRADGATAMKIAAALEEVEHAIREAFPEASKVTVRTEVSDVLVNFLPGQKPVSVVFNSVALDAYRRCAEAVRQQALGTLRLVCAFAFAREYAPDHDPVTPFIIDAKMALSGSLT